MDHLPLLRAGKPYQSLSTLLLRNITSGDVVAEVSQANSGLIARDLAHKTNSDSGLQALDTEELLSMCVRAGDFFKNADLPLGNRTQSAADYVRQVTTTTGLPNVLVRTNMIKIYDVLTQMTAVLDGLTRGLDLRVLDHGHGRQNDRMLSYVAQTKTLGAILPNNSPGVHSLWLPAIPLKIPLVLKPGRDEPWTPLRLAHAFIAAGCPLDAFNFYPSDHTGATEVLLRCGRCLLFGDGPTVDAWREDSRVQIHGPGRSKILIGSDEADNWEDHLDMMVDSIVANSGRSCINTSGIWVTAHGRDIADAIALRLSRIRPRPLTDTHASLAAFGRPEIAQRTSATIDTHLSMPGAQDITAGFRGNERVVSCAGCTFLQPTVIFTSDPKHPLANSEFLFPFATVVELPKDEIPRQLGPSLVVTAITTDDRLRKQLLTSPNVERLNLGPIPTHQISWDQPHEGNLFDFLYRQRALQSAA